MTSTQHRYITAMLNEPFHDMERYLHNLFHEDPRRSTTLRSQEAHDVVVRPLKPVMDLHENAESNIVTATLELPGFKKEDVNIDVLNGTLNISAENKISSEHDEKGYVVRERRYGKYFRSLQLPQGVQPDEVKASMKNGILTLTFPRVSPISSLKKITIS